jgi:hypothetical protein
MTPLCADSIHDGVIVIVIVHLLNSFRRTMALGSTQSLT